MSSPNSSIPDRSHSGMEMIFCNKALYSRLNHAGMTTFLYFFKCFTVFVFFCIFFAVNPNIIKGEEISEKPPDIISPEQQGIAEDHAQPQSDDTAEPEA